MLVWLTDAARGLPQVGIVASLNQVVLQPESTGRIQSARRGRLARTPYA